MIYTGERLVPDQFGLGDRILIEHVDRYRFASRMLRRDSLDNGTLRILDAPCGVGYGAVLLAEQNQADVTGLDNDANTIAYAKRRYRAVPRLTFKTVNLDVDSLEEEAYDAVVCFEGIEHVVRQFAVARKLSRAVVRGGMVFVSTPRRGGPGAGSEFHTRELVRGELLDLFYPHLSSIRMYGQDIVVEDQEPDDQARFYVMVGTK